MEALTLNLYVYPIIVNDDYTIDGARATDEDGNYIVGTDEGDGQYSFANVSYGEYVIVAYKEGIRPQIVNGYSRFIILPKLTGEELAASEFDARDLKTVLNSVINYILLNDSGWSGTPPTPIS